MFWDILDRTIRDPERNLYLFIDEAHRGLGANASSERGTATIYANLIDGLDGRAAMPVVVGISATPQRFEAAMDQRADRVRMPKVAVTPREVQESGLLKDIIELRVPEKDDPVEHQYLTMACERYALACREWDEYCAREGESPVNPLLLIQAADNVSSSALAEMCDQITGLVPGLSEAMSFANVFGEHKDIAAGKYPSPCRARVRSGHLAHSRALRQGGCFQRMGLPASGGHLLAAQAFGLDLYRTARGTYGTHSTCAAHRIR